MGQQIRSARGELIDFEMLAIKQQLAAAPVPKAVEQRKRAIDAKDGVRSAKVEEPEADEFLAMSHEAAETSGRAKQTSKK
ncbi:hypothetical protein [Acinetobacter sp.]|uniref:hypothetical protein n=1 Tax=Acinetobacter sp. TaxID=472 RepID=UPI00388D1C07